MFTAILNKELKMLLLSPKFTATFAVASILILLSVEIGIREYQNTVTQTDTARRLTEERLSQQSGWMGASVEAFRTADPLQVFVTGVSKDVGRFSSVDATDPVKLQNSAYGDDPVFALFRSIDFAFIVTAVLSLFAILFSYDSVNGEREQGTLQLTFANPVPRVQFILAKFAGAWLGLIVPLTIPVLIAALLVMVQGVPMTGPDWVRFAMLLGLSLLYFTCFLVFGILVSALTRRSNVAFLICLAGWILLVLVLPRAAMMAAGLSIPVPSVAEVEGQRDAFAKGQWEEYMKAAGERWRQRQEPQQGMSDPERDVYRDAHIQGWMDEEDGERKTMQARIEAEGRRLEEDLRNRKNAQEGLGYALAMISPASAYQLAAMTLAGTDPGLKTRYENAIQDYRTLFNAYVEKRQKETGGSGGMRITFDSNKGFSFSAPRERGTIDVGGVPRFSPPVRPTGELILAVMPHAGMLAAIMLFALAGSLAAFLRYDVR